MEMFEVHAHACMARNIEDPTMTLLFGDTLLRDATVVRLPETLGGRVVHIHRVVEQCPFCERDCCTATLAVKQGEKTLHVTDCKGRGEFMWFAA